MAVDASVKGFDTLVSVLCFVLFGLFCFAYLYCYQADLMTFTQYVLAHGQTHYNHLVGALLITVLLSCLSIGVLRLFKHISFLPALAFFPSSVLLASVSGLHRQAFGCYTFGSWPIWLVVLLMLFVSLVSWMKSARIADLIFVRRMSLAQSSLASASVLLALFAFVCLSSNGNRVLHTQLHVEQCILDGDVDGAMSALDQSTDRDSSLTMLSAYVLSMKGSLGEHLFERPLLGGSASLLPDGKTVGFAMIPESTLFDYVGIWTLQRMSPTRYLEFLQRRHKGKRAAADYLLCAYLLDKKLDRFVAALPKYYKVNDSLPKHYREALLLYTHLHTSPAIIYKNNVMEADFQDYQKLSSETPDKRERETKLRDTYGNTYWFYYQYIAD